jgi:hypothetical protein
MDIGLGVVQVILVVARGIVTPSSELACSLDSM